MQRTTGPGIRLRDEEFREHGRKAGAVTLAALAAYVGVDQATISRMFNGYIKPGESTIASVLTAFPDLKFEDLFEVVQSDAEDIPA